MLTEVVPSQGGYEVIMGMLKWASPLDYNRTFEVVADALYKKVIKEKVREAQTDEVVEYRTRYVPRKPCELDFYPYDTVLFQSDEPKKHAEKQEEKPSRGIDLLRKVELTKNKTDVSAYKKEQYMAFNADFFGEVNLRAIKFFFKQNAANKNSIFNVTISIWDDSTCVFFQQYNSDVYYQMATH